MKKKLSVLFLLALAAATIPFFLPKPAQLELELTDRTFGLDPTGNRALVTDLRSGRQLPLEVQKEEAGRPRLVIERLASGPAELSVEVEGYQPKTVRVEVPPLVRSRAAVSLESAYGRALVEILDAKAGTPLPGATLEAPSGQVRRGNEGLEVFLVPGEHTLSASANSFCNGTKTFQIQRGEETRVLLPLSPHLVAGEAARIVLDWGENPRDLDAHVLLDATNASLPNTHAYFGRKEIKTPDGRPLAQLDVDYLNSEGLETITAHSTVDGTFRYFVHHYGGSGALGSSGAQVTVSTRGCKQKVYTVSADCSQKYWEVVDLKVTTDTVEILERGRCTDEAPRKWRSRKG